MKRNTFSMTAILLVFAALVFLVSCSSGTESVPKTYKKGDVGPAGGIIVWDKGSVEDYTYYEDGTAKKYQYRYIEAAPEDVTVTDSSTGTTISEFMLGYCLYPDSDIYGNTDEGSGKYNTIELLKTADKRYEGTDTTSNKVTNFAAKVADDYTYINPKTGEKYEDWFLPSMEELQAVMAYRNQLNIDTAKSYLSSTSYQQRSQNKVNDAKVTVVTADGTNNDSKVAINGKYPIRAVRYVY